MEVALKNFAANGSGKKVAILGEMLELGSYSGIEHKRIAKLVESMGFALNIFVGKGFENNSKSGLYFEDSDSCSRYLIDNPINDSIVLLKGSRGVKLERVMEYL